MSTATPALTLDTASTPGIPFSRLVGVEFRKSYDTRAGFWLLAVMGILVAVAEVIAVLVCLLNDIDSITFGTFATVAGVITGLLLPVLGIMLVTTEWTQRSAMVTFTLESRRTRVILAKLLVGLLLTLATIVFVVVVGAICNAVFVAFGGETTWVDSEFVQGIVGFALSQALAMILGFAFAALFLNTAAAIVIYFAYSFVLPTLFAIGSVTMDWFDKLADWIDFNAAQQPLFEIVDMTGKEWAQLLVSGAIWLGIPLVIGLRRILRAEVK
ncbi:ABC transporter permease [Nocardioides sp.]|uniref:ABC transporter permease n=1 Tax=Nocardioides sp. TaxID=35761 RepID=UPI0039E641AD